MSAMEKSGCDAVVMFPVQYVVGQRQFRAQSSCAPTVSSPRSLMSRRGSHGPSDTVLYVVLFCYYVCNFFVIVYFNAALAAHVVTRLRGGEPTIGQSLGAATACLPQIAAWSLVSATVGVILHWLSERAGFLGRIAIALVGFAWTS